MLTLYWHLLQIFWLNFSDLTIIPNQELTLQKQKRDHWSESLFQSSKRFSQQLCSAFTFRLFWAMSCSCLVSDWDCRAKEMKQGLLGSLKNNIKLACHNIINIKWFSWNNGKGSNANAAKHSLLWLQLSQCYCTVWLGSGHAYQPHLSYFSS